LNVCHEFKEKKNTALKEAVESLLDFSSDLDINLTCRQTAVIKDILRKLSSIGCYYKGSLCRDRAICQMEAQYDKYRSLLPALSDIIER
jgi:hypothetical protein